MALDETETARALPRTSRERARASAVSVQIEVPFHDVDSLGIVWHGHYFKYLEMARTALMRGHGLDARDLRELGFGMVMIDCRCRHIAPLRYGDVARVFAWLCDVFVDEGYRGQGIGGALVAAAVGHPELAGLKRFVLATADAHDVYRRHGFEVLDHPERWMIRRGPGA